MNTSGAVVVAAAIGAWGCAVRRSRPWTAAVTVVAEDPPDEGD
jgi:hypothetical protein